MKNNYRTETDYLPINRWPQDERSREKLIKKGPEYLSDCELMAIILRTEMGNSKEKFSASDLAKKILVEYGSLKNLLDLLLSEFLKIKGIGRAKAAQVMAAIELGRRAVSEKNGNNVSFRCGDNMRIIAFIEDYKVIRKILDYLGIYEFRRDKPQPKKWLWQINLMTIHKMII